MENLTAKRYKELNFPVTCRPEIALCLQQRQLICNEMPNVPHIELELAEHYAVAKIKEAVIAVTGR